MTKTTLRRQDLAEIAKLLIEAAAAVRLLPESISARHRVRTTLAPDLEAFGDLAHILADGRTHGVTLEQAKVILARSWAGGNLLGTSATDGGRAWLDGEWGLDELEALCLFLRHEAGDTVSGASEFVPDCKDG
jgi:hypothetical protein